MCKMLIYFACNWFHGSQEHRHRFHPLGNRILRSHKCSCRSSSVPNVLHHTHCHSGRLHRVVITLLLGTSYRQTHRRRSVNFKPHTHSETWVRQMVKQWRHHITHFCHSPKLCSLLPALDSVQTDFPTVSEVSLKLEMKDGRMMQIEWGREHEQKLSTYSDYCLAEEKEAYMGCFQLSQHASQVIQSHVVNATTRWEHRREWTKNYAGDSLLFLLLNKLSNK